MAKKKRPVPDDYKIPSDERGFPYHVIDREMKRLMGNVEVAIDAAIPEPKQNKAVKYLIKSQIEQMLYDMQMYSYEKGKNGKRHVIEGL